MFFEHHGRQSSMMGTNQLPSAGKARRSLAAIALAVGLVGAMALPLRAADNTADNTTANSVADGNSAANPAAAAPAAAAPAAGPTTAPSAAPSAAPTTGDAAADQQPGSVAQLIAEVQAEKLDDTQLMQRGVAELNNKNYEEALALFQQINTDNKDQAYKDSLSRVMNDAQHGSDERKAARASFEKGQEDLQAGNNADAVSQFTDAVNNKYADPGTIEKAKEQLAVAQAAPANPAAGQTAAAAKPADPRSTYFAAKAAYRRGDLADAKTQFESLQAAGYKAPLFERGVGDYLKDIDSKMAAKAPETPAAPTAQATAPASPDATAPQTPAAPAAPEANNNAVSANPTTAPSETPEAAAPAVAQLTRDQIKQAYEVGRSQYRKGDWINARKNLQVAADANYDPGLFNDKPDKILARMDAKEQADAAQAARDAARNQTEVANATGGSTALAVPPTTAPTAEATTPPAAPATPEAAAPAPSSNEVAAAPATAPSNVPGNELQTTAELNKVTTEKNAFEARQLVQQADTLRTNGNNEGALEKYSLAVEKDGTNAQAIKGKNELMELTGRSTAGGVSQLDRVQTEIETRRQAISYSFDTAIADANGAIAGNNYDDAQRAVERAKVARNQDPQIFTPSEINHFDSTIATTQLHVDNAKSAYDQQQARTNAQTAQAAADRRLQEELRNRRATVAGLIHQSMQLTHEGKYEESLGVIDQILVIDPQNEYALGTRPLVEDKALLQEQRRYKEDFDRQLSKTWNLADEQRIPYNDIIRYPDNWPGLSEIRDQSIAAEQGGQKEDLAVQQQLDKVLPMEVKFDNTAFVDVVAWMHEVTNANINVNWPKLEAAGIDKTALVNVSPLHNVTFRKILRTVLDDVGGGTVKLSYTVDEGVIDISTDEDLASRAGVLRIYDVRDLLLVPPDFTNAPDFNITSNNTQTSGAGGGGGGGSSQSLFSGSTGTGTQNGPQQQTHQDQIDDLKKKVEELVSTDSWVENGGKGSLDEFPAGSGQLLVNQTPENHLQISGILEQLRENRAIQITIETRFLKVQRNFLEDIGLSFDFQFNNVSNNINGGGPIQFNQNSSTFTQSSNLDTTLPGNLATLLPGAALSTSLTYINDFQVSALIRATQATQTATTITAPRLTLYNGEEAYLVVATTQAYVSNLTPVVGSNAIGFSPTINTVNSGVVLNVQATVSADRKYVTMVLQPELSNLLALVPFVIGGSETIPTGNSAATQPFANQGVIQQPEQQITEVKTTATVPDGGTLLLGGQTLSGDIEREMGVPILSKIPFLKRLFTNRSYAKDDQVLLILVKPTIIIEREQEQKQFPLLSSKTNG